jgi:hypothetical protein
MADPVQCDGAGSTVLNHTKDDELINTYIKYKRLDMIRMGMDERDIEQAIESYMDWRTRHMSWQAAEQVMPTKTCPYCTKRPVQKMTPAGLICHLCFMTRRLCTVEGCRNVIVMKSSKCIKHYLKQEAPKASTNDIVEKAEVDMRCSAIRNNLSGL